MKTKELYTPPCAESFDVVLEQPIAVSYNKTNRTERFMYDEDEEDL